MYNGFIHSGLITSSLYSMKYLTDLFLPYGSFFETNILLTLISSILNIFLFFVKNTFFDFFYLQNSHSSHSFFFIIIWVSKEWSYTLRHV